MTVAPANDIVGLGATKQFTAVVTGLGSSAVTWSVNGILNGNAIVGTINGAGLYTAPAIMPTPATVTIKATSVESPSTFGLATLTLKYPAPVLESVSFMSGAFFTFTVTGEGFQTGAVVWVAGVALTTTYVSPIKLTGTVDKLPGGIQPVYVENPGSLPSNSINVNLPDGGGSTVLVIPAGAIVPQGTTLQFTAMQGGNEKTAEWSVNGTVGGNATFGTIAGTGLYTAPAVIPNPSQVTISAKVSSGSVGSTTASIVPNVPPSISSLGKSQEFVGVFSLTVYGSNFVSASKVRLNGAAMPTQFVSPGQLTASCYVKAPGAVQVTVANGSLISPHKTLQAGPVTPLVTATAARRFLQQAAFGPDRASADRVQQIGMAAWLDEQLAMAKISGYQNIGTQRQNLAKRFLVNAVAKPDQLRQRVAFALSQIAVVSTLKVIQVTFEAPFQEMLLENAFGNYRKVLYDVTTSPTMGLYLDMVNNGKMTGGVPPNENYARELLQLFSLGTTALKPNGTPILDGGGQPVENYNQATVSEFARALTGWTYARVDGKPSGWKSAVNMNAPMVPYMPQHDTGAKTLLNGVVLPPGQSAEQDLNGVVDNAFNHSSTGPFISRQLIQHLVTGNPTPAYVGRIAAVFNNNGLGVRGDLKAVVRAILLDPEARGNDAAPPGTGDGQLLEPALFLAGIFRAMGAELNDTHSFATDMEAMLQDVFSAPSVFNFFRPDHIVPGTSLYGGEFQIFTPYAALYRLTIMPKVYSATTDPIEKYGTGFTNDVGIFVDLAANPVDLVEALDITLTRGTMPTDMKQIITTAVQNESGTAMKKFQTALYLITASGYYNVAY